MQGSPRERDRATSRLMDDAALQRFIMHYERLTHHMLAEMPRRVDVVLRLNKNHGIHGIRIQKHTGGPTGGGL